MIFKKPDIPYYSLKKFKEQLPVVFTSFLVLIFSFPEVDLGYSVGIDPPLKWLYNHLFSAGLNQGEKIIFPHGPLAFLMYPLAVNYLLAVIVSSFLQVVFTVLLFRLFGKTHWIYLILTALISWFIFSISNFNQLLLSNILIGYLIYLKNEKKEYKYWAFALVAMAFYVKAYVAIISGVITFSFLTIELLRKTDIKKTLGDCLCILIFMLIFWALMFHNLTGFWGYCIGMYHLAGDNSAAAAYYPANNWLFLTVFLVIVSAISFFQPNKEAKLFGFLFLPGFFAGWKYGMAREDYFHSLIFLCFVICSMLLFLVYNRKKIIINTLILSLAFLLFILNMKNVENPQPFALNYSGIVNFKKFVSAYPQIKKDSEKQNLENIARNRLPEIIRNKIGNATVDVYPWDYTIIAANQLNWKPRPVIQSYAAYTSWLDKKNAGHFKSLDAPEFFIWGLNNSTSDLNGGNLASIDNRYLLNDEPLTLTTLITRYERIYNDANFIVYRKLKHATELNQVITKTQTAKFDEWISVPDSIGNFTKLKLHLRQSFAGKVKSFLYKDELYYIYLKTTDSTVLKYRIVPQNAVDGIWISPFQLNAGDRSPAEKIIQVMLKCSGEKMVRNQFNYEWEYAEGAEKMVQNFLGKGESPENEILYLNKSLNFNTDNQEWVGFSASNLRNDAKNQKYYHVNPESFAPAFSILPDSAYKFPLKIKVNCWIKSMHNAHSTLVIETEYTDGQKKWQGADVNRQIINPETTNHVFSFVEVKIPFKKINIYLWNNGKKPVRLYDMNIKALKFM